MVRFILLAACCLLSQIWAGCDCRTQEPGNSQYVNPLIGTDGLGHTYPGATVPFGMVQLSPETGNFKWDYTAGYQYADSLILGFAHTHLSGTGVSDLGDLLFFPFRGEKERYASGFDKSTEQASAGYYSVVLADDGIRAEMTATEKVGVHRYTFEKGGPVSLLVDAQTGLVNNPTEWANHVLEGDIQIEGGNTLSGYIQTRKWVTKRTFFTVEFDRPITGSRYIDGENNRRLVLDFDMPDGGQLGARVALSTVSVEGAKKNARQAAGMGFDQVRARAVKRWDDCLATVEIEGTREQKENFYTSLYHLLIQPNEIADLGGEYRGADDKVGKSPIGAYYSTLSLWDTFRAAHPLYTILYPELDAAVVNSMLLHFEAVNTLPVWTLMGRENFCMVGNHAVPVIVDAWCKGLPGIDPERAYRAVKGTLTGNGNPKCEWGQYDEHGYFPSDMTRVEAVSRTLECGFDDWCAAQMARGLGHTDDYEFFSKRAGFYKNLFDPSTGLMRGRNSDGGWVSPFDPLIISHAATSGGDYTEGNAWQYSFHVLHDVPGLVELMGGRERFIAKLDTLFTMEPTVHGEGAVVDVTGLVGQYAHGNEPSHHVAYLYAMAGAPWKTQELIPEILSGQYANTPDGLIGNDDCGQMSAWYIFSSLGFYPVNPADGKYIFGVPAYKEARLRVGDRTLTIEAPGLSPENRYVHSVTLNGTPLTEGFITHRQIMDGGRLTFVMGPDKEPA